MPRSSDQWTIVVDYRKIEELAQFQFMSVNLNELAMSQKLQLGIYRIERYSTKAMHSGKSIYLGIFKTFKQANIQSLC